VIPLITDARYQHRRGPVEDIIIAEGDKVVIRRTVPAPITTRSGALRRPETGGVSGYEHPPLLLVFLPARSKIVETGRAQAKREGAATSTQTM
jgi:hypothetical protein